MLLTLVVGCLLAGLIGMHHLAIAVPGEPGPIHVAAAAGGHDIAAQPQPAPDPHDEHGGTVLHLCLAVLTAFALLIPVLLVLLRVPSGSIRLVTRMRGPTNSWASQFSTSRHLAQLCVLRT